MYLKRLDIQGFKSFANKTALEFETGITAIVGPNGSGKSNIADSIRWVLGEQSSKQLRGKKSADVIFAGSDKKARQSFAEVSVTFDNADRKIALDYSEVSITRRMDRSGESDYLINGNKVRLLDIIDLVLKSNIGTSRYTVIGQGTIDQMILSGPSEVKNLIDEASGVKTYFIRRDKAMRRMEQTGLNLMRVKDLLAEIEPRLKSLRRQAKKMQEREAVEVELRSLQSANFSGKYWQFEEALYALNSKLDVLVAVRRELEAQVEQQRKTLEKGEASNRAEVEGYQNIQKEIKKLLEQKNKLAEDAAMIRGKLQAQKNSGVGSGDAKTLELDRSNSENSKKQLHSEIERAKEAVKKIESELKQKTKIFEEVSAELGKIQGALENPDKIDFVELAEGVTQLEQHFAEFYSGLESAADLGTVLPLAQNFRQNFLKFKDKTAKFAQNPFANFEKQRKALNEILIQKDRLNQELNRLDLEKSKNSINLEYFERELVKVDQKLLQTNLELRGLSAGSQDDYFQQLLEQEQQLNAEILKIGQSVGSLEQKISEYHVKEQSQKKEILDEERKFRLNQDEIAKLKDQESVLQIEKAKLETQRENILGEIMSALGESGLAQIKKEKIASSHSNLDEKIQKLKNQLDMIGGIDELTLKEYQETETRYTYLDTQVKDLDKALNDLKSVIEELDGHIKKQFQDAFNRVDQQFQEYFRVLFNGGRAYLSVLHANKEKESDIAEAGAAEEDSAAENSGAEKLRPEEKLIAKYGKASDDITGIDIKATPPGKKLSGITALSGGERALTSIALLCALLTCFPSPFVVLDEVDAALDEANTIRFAKILASLAGHTQFITVSHNRETMRQAHTLYGITMGDDSISKVLSLKVEQATAYAK